MAAIDDIKTRILDGRREVFDPVRRRWVSLTPEEWVRQQTIVMLHNRYGYPLELMQVECAIIVSELTKRCDIVVYGSDVKPLIIVECKRQEVNLTQKVADQACRYNLVLNVPYLLLTNGRQQLCLYADTAAKSLTQVAIPKYECTSASVR